MKKVIIVFILTSGLSSILLSCFCKTETPFWLMKSFSIDYQNPSFLPIMNDSTNVDTLLLQLQANPEFVAVNANPLRHLMVNSAYGFQCPDPGSSGLKHTITGISISSNEDFNSIIAGDELRQECLFFGLSYSQFLENQENYLTEPFSPFSIQINTKPSQAIQRNFTVVISFSDGQSLQSTGGNLVWY